MTRQQLEGAIEALDLYRCSDEGLIESIERYKHELAALPPEPDYRALLVEAANEISALAKEGLTIDAELKHDLRTFAARIRAALEGK